MASMPSFTYKPGRFFSLKQQGAHCPFRRFFGKKIIHLHIFSVELHNKHITKMYMVQMFLQRMSTDQEDMSTQLHAQNFLSCFIFHVIKVWLMMWGTGVWGVFLACVRRVFFLNINAVGAVFPPQVEFFWFMMWTVEHTSYFRFFFNYSKVSHWLA